MRLHKMEKLLVGFRNQDHSSFGGYDWITKVIVSDNLSDTDVIFSYLKAGERGKRINLFFLDLICRIKRHKYKLIHYYYGDYCLFFPILRKNQIIVATIHENILDRSNYYRKILASLDGIICLSNSQALQVKELGINKNVVFIPHGFNPPKFIFDLKITDKIDSNKINIFYSGTKYRDFHTMYRLTLFLRDSPEFMFHLVGQNNEIKSKMQDMNNVKVYDRLSDDTYFSLLQSCDYNFLPLTFSTANNTLLEAQSLGVKSILPKISGIADYAAGEGMNLFYEDFKSLTVHFSNLSKSDTSAELISYSKKFEWSNIAVEIENFYERLELVR